MFTAKFVAEAEEATRICVSRSLRGCGPGADQQGLPTNSAPQALGPDMLAIHVFAGKQAPLVRGGAPFSRGAARPGGGGKWRRSRAQGGPRPFESPQERSVWRGRQPESRPF